MYRIPAHSLTVLDKGFVSAALLLQIQNHGAQCHWLTAAKSNAKWTRLDEHPTDYHVQMRLSPQARKANPEPVHVKIVVASFMPLDVFFA